MSAKDIYASIRRKAKLPTPSKVALEVMRLCYSEHSSLQEIANIIEGDPALSAELLKYANSAMMAPTRPVASVQRAAVQIGMRGVVNLTLSLSLLATAKHKECSGFSYNSFWSKSLAQAVAARGLSAKSKQHDADEMFTCALLSHVGELGLASAFPDEYSTILSQDLSEDELLIAEENNFLINHNELTLMMLEDWGIPKEYRLGIRYQNQPHLNEISEEHRTLAKLFALSRQIANICMLDLPLTRTFDSIERIAEEFGIPADGFNQFFDDIVSSWQEWGDLYQIPTQHCPLYYQIKTLEQPKLNLEPQSNSDGDIIILAVDDDPLTLLNLTRLLKKEGRTIITAEDGRQALKLTQEQQPHMVITDWRMPHLDGLELCITLRSTSKTQHTYIIMLTSNESDEELVQAFDAGADDYVVKPFTPKVLEARIRSGERLIRYQRMINADREVIQRYATKLATANRKLQTMAMTDALTGLPNRRSAMARLREVVAESSRYGQQLSCMMIDIDHFKKINDTYGHDNGDTVLKEVAEIFNRNARSYDMVSRMGGEEFLVISTRSGQEDSLHLAERLRAAVETHDIRFNDGVTAKVTISVGVATWSETFTNGEEMIKAADDALYNAKRAGRNQVQASW